MLTDSQRVSDGETPYARKTRARILAAAERRFKHYGCAKTSMVDIASDCAMSHANLYRFFRGKIDLVDAIAAAWLAKSERICSEVASRPTSARERLVEFVATLHRWKLREYVKDSRAHELLAIASHERRPFIAIHLETLARLLVDIIEDGNARGEFDVRDPAGLATVVQHATVRFTDPSQVARYAGEPLEAQARAVMTLLVTGIPTPR